MVKAPSESKLRGGYYTPTPIADYLAGWAVTRTTSKVLEPSAGDGSIVSAASRKLKRGKVQAIEFNAVEADKIRSLDLGNVDVATSDAFSWYRTEMDGTYDAVVGNPPFIRYQTFPEEHRGVAFALMADEGLAPNRMTNAWVPFVVLATRALRPGGRLAMVVPAELLQVSYAAELRGYLARNYTELTIVTFRKLVFDGIQQETVLLLGKRSRSQTAACISFVELQYASDLKSFRAAQVERVPADLDHAREKWIQYYLTPSELGLIRSLEDHPQLTTLGQMADVDVGIVTGRNEFFVLTPSDANRMGLTDSCERLVGRSAQIPGLALHTDEWQSLEAANGRCLLLQLGRTPREDLPPNALAYVREGEALGHHLGYKCRIRQPTWWNVPSAHIPDAFMLRQIHDGPRIIYNDAFATCTDTIHRVRALPGTDARWLAAASMNSLTFAFSEVRGRSYGGGVLELEPTEAEGLPFPRPSGDLPLDDLDLWARVKDTGQMLDEVDRLVLRPCGLTQSEIDALRGIWAKLSTRRMDRKRR